MNNNNKKCMNSDNSNSTFAENVSTVDSVSNIYQLPSQPNITGVTDPVPLKSVFFPSKYQPTIDLILTLTSFASIHALYLGNLNFSSPRSVALFSALLFLTVSLYVGGVYRSDKTRSLGQEITSVMACWLVAFGCIGLFVYLTKTGESISRIWFTTSMAVCLGSLATARVLQWLGLKASENGKALNIVLYGNPSDIKPVVDQLNSNPNSQVNLLDTLACTAESVHKPGNSKVAPHSETMLNKLIEQYRLTNTPVDQVWITSSASLATMTEDLSTRLFDTTVDVCVVPDQFTQQIIKGELTNHGGIETINISEVSLPLAAEQFKRAVDVVLGSVALILLSVPMLIISMLIKLDSKGPVLFRQLRYGIDGREIEVLKFRSMEVHSEDAVTQASKNDSRVTRLGSILRRTSLDELPQFINVVQGSMSLVGPRPHAISHNEMWRAEIHGYMLRHKIKPGITGWAQVNGWRGETDTTFKMQQRVRYDLAYIKNWSPWLDMKILLLTLVVGFVHKNAY